MTFRPKFLALTFCSAAALSLAACSEPEQELTPFETGLARLEAGDGIGAEKAFQEAMDAGVSRNEIAAFMGEAELLQGQLAEAREWLAKGEFTDEHRSRGYHMLARLEMRMGNLPAAGQAFDQALKTNMDDPELWVDIGRLRYVGGEQVQAIDAAQRAVELGPQNAAALHFRGQLVRDAHGMAAAIPWLEAALKLEPDNPRMLTDLAATQGELGQAKAMLVTLRKLAKVDPGNRQTIFMQAVLAARAGKTALARSLLQRSGNIDREVPAAMLLSGAIDLQNGNYASAAQTFDKLAKKQPENKRLQVLLARALSLGGNDRELVHRYGDIALRPSASPYLMAVVGRSYEQLGDRKAAAFFLDRAAQPRRSNLIAMQGSEARALAARRAGASGDDTLSLVRELIVNGQTGQALERSEQFWNRFAGSADASSLAGDAQLVRRNAQAALQRYETSAKVRRPWHLARRMIMTYRAIGQGAKAEALVADYLRGDPGNVEATSLMATALADAQKWQAAAKLLDHAIAQGGSRDPGLIALRARVAIALGDKDGGLMYAEQAYAMQPANPMTANMLVLARNTAGQPAGPTNYLAAKARVLPAR
ncbi:MAG: tetratricopeptide repeat protein [Erythrobacter sp.]